MTSAIDLTQDCNLQINLGWNVTNKNIILQSSAIVFNNEGHATDAVIIFFFLNVSFFKYHASSLIILYNYRIYLFSFENSDPVSEPVRLRRRSNSRQNRY